MELLRKLHRSHAPTCSWGEEICQGYTYPVSKYKQASCKTQEASDHQQTSNLRGWRFVDDLSTAEAVHTVMIVVGDNFFRKGKAFKVVKESERNENGFLYSWAEGK